MKLADKWSKQKILTAYLNQIYYGSQAYGVEAAAQTYFSKPAKKLKLAQAALLAGLPQAPSRYDPFANPERCRARRKEVLRAMLDDRRDHAAPVPRVVRNHNLHLKPASCTRRSASRTSSGTCATSSFACTARRACATAACACTRRSIRGCSAPRAKAIQDTLYLSNDPAAAVVAIDPATGAIRAMTAVSPGRAHNQFNLIADARRQPGRRSRRSCSRRRSSRAWTPSRRTTSRRHSTATPGPARRSRGTLETYDHTYVGNTSVANATLRSDNTVYARLTLDVGAENVAKMAQKLGVRTPLDVNGYYVPSIGLGSIAVTPLDMASAYATFAARGIYSKPMAITKVVLAERPGRHEGRWGAPERKQVISPGVAYEVTKILQENITSGTGVGCELRQARGGQDGHDREPRRRLVLRLHAATRDDGLDGLSARARSR